VKMGPWNRDEKRSLFLMRLALRFGPRIEFTTSRRQSSASHRFAGKLLPGVGVYDPRKS